MNFEIGCVNKVDGDTVAGAKRNERSPLRLYFESQDGGETSPKSIFLVPVR